MTDSPSHDQPEAERLNPEQRLTQRRKGRDEEDYYAWCESSYGMVEIGQEQFHPADVLETMAPDAARRGRDECSAMIRKDLELAVCEQFPALIAVPFHSFLEGPRASLTRLHRLRDTWESLIRLLAALALSEAAATGTLLRPLALREGMDQGWRECKRRDLLSDKLAVRIGLIEGVLHRARELEVDLQVASLLPIGLLSEVRRLNVVRNGFSHASTMSEVQAEEIIEESYPVLREVLLDLRELQSIDLIRILRFHVGGSAEVERLNGHAQSRSISELTLDDAAALLTSTTPVDGMDRVFARLSGLTLDLSPFLYAADNDTGHRTSVWCYKSRNQNEWRMECVADSTTKTLVAVQHEARLVRFENLLGRDGEGVSMSEDSDG